MKKVLKYSSISLLILLAVLGCQKGLKDKPADINLQDKLTPAVAEQWYKQKFSQTDFWKSAWLQSKNFPDWKNPVYKKIGDMELLEFPLRKQHTSLLVASSSLSSTQVRQIVNASLTKVVFIKKPDNRMYIREIDYIPDWNYLQKKSFDISKTSLGLAGDDFTGKVIVKDWKGVIISMRLVQDGKITSRISRAPAQSSSGRINSCSVVEVCMWYEDCDVIGDQWTDNCGEPYMDPNDCYLDYVCDDDEDPCVMYGNCGDGTGGGSGGGESASPVQSVTNNITDPCKNAALSTITNTNIQNFVTGFYNKYLVPTDSKFNLVINEAPDITVNGQPVPAYTTSLGNNTWQITLSSTYYSSANGYNMSQQAYALVIAHEIIHVAILANNINPGGNDHALMFKNFIDTMKDLLVDAYGMSESDALGLGLSGMNDLWGYGDFDQLMYDTYGKHTSDVQTTLDLYTKGAGGTKC